MQRTWDKGDGSKRGDYALSKERQKEMTESYRTLEPDLQRPPKEVKVRITNNHTNTFDFCNQDEVCREPPRRPPSGAATNRSSNHDPTLILGVRQDAVLRDKALSSVTSPSGISRQIKELRDHQSSITCLPRSSVSPAREKIVIPTGPEDNLKYVISKENEKGGRRHQNAPQVTRFQATNEQFKEMGLSHHINPKEVQVKSAKRYYRGMQINEPKTFHNQTYQNQPPQDKQPVYAKGTKKFWDRTIGLHTQTFGKIDAERDLVPKVR